MKKISEFNPCAEMVPVVGRSVSPEAAKVVNDLFVALKVIFPAWRQALPDKQALDVARREWTKAFMDNGVVTLAQVELGKRRARQSEIPFFPSSGQFLAWCKPDLADFGLPDVETAYREACCAGMVQPFSHVAVLVAARETGGFELRSRPRRESFPIFARNYGVVCRRVLAGEKLDEVIPKALPAEVSIPASDKTVKRCFGEINSILGR